MWCATVLSFTALAIAGPVAASDVKGDQKQLDKPATSDPLVFLVIPRPEPLMDRLTDPRFLSYLNLSTRYQAYQKGKSAGELRATVNLIATQLASTWDQALRDLTGGGIIVNVEADPGQPPRISVAIVARKPEVLEKANQVFLNMVRQDARTKGKADPVQTSEHGGVPLHAVGGQSGIAYAIADGKLLVSNSAKNLERLVDRIGAQKPRSGNASALDQALLGALGDRAEWKVARDRQGSDTMAWGYANLGRLRQLDPQRFSPSTQPDTGAMLLFGSWYQAVVKAEQVTAAVRWTERELGASIELPVPSGGRAQSLKGYVPEPGQGVVCLIQPPGTIASLSLWRDWSTIWESKADLFPPETVQGFAQLDTVAGQFFGAREFGPDVLGAFKPHWRLVVARQDYDKQKAQPDLKLPAFALVTELNQPDSDFAQRLKVAFQTFVGLSNVDAVQKKGPPLELGTENVDGITLATAHYMTPQGTSAGDETPNQRYNFSPSAAQVDKYFLLSSSAGLARALIKDLKSGGGDKKPRERSDLTFVVEASGTEFARLLELNRNRLAMRVMLDRGETKENADAQVELGLALFRYLGQGRLAIRDDARASSLELNFHLAKDGAGEAAR
jgi:hypothetical protein